LLAVIALPQEHKATTEPAILPLQKATYPQGTRLFLIAPSCG